MNTPCPDCGGTLDENGHCPDCGYQRAEESDVEEPAPEPGPNTDEGEEEDAERDAPGALRHRAFVVAVDQTRMATRAEGDERIPIAFSSEQPVMRYDWWEGERYFEVLDHEPSSVDMTYAREGLPFLLQHDQGDQVGIVEEIAIEGDRKGRGMLRLSKSVRGREIAQDILDGIRTRISFGYVTGEDYEQTGGEAGAIPTRRYRKWTPMEVSSVSVPADVTVGVGRSADFSARRHRGDQRRTTNRPHEARSPSMSDKDNAARGAAPTPEPAQTRAELIADIAELAGAPQKTGEWIRSGKSIGEIRTEAIALRNANAPAPATPPAPAVEDYSDGKRVFSLARAVQAARSGNWKDAGYERSVSESEAKRLGRNVGGNTFLFPTMRKLTEQEMAVRAAQKAGSATVGGNLVFTEYGGFIEQLVNRSVVMQLGATVLPGLQGNVAFPRLTSGTTAYWMAENSGTDVTESNAAWDQVTLSPKTLMARARYTNQLLAQGVLNVDAFIQADLALRLALALDLAAIHGSGASNQPQGIYGATGVNSVTFGGAIDYPKVTKMIEALAVDNVPLEALAFITTPEVMQDAMTTQKFSSTNGDPVWMGPALNGQMAGIKAVATNQVAKTLGTGSDHGIVLGAWPELLIGEWGAVAITVDPYTLAGQDEVRIIARELVDIDLRHGESFCTGATLTATA